MKYRKFYYFQLVYKFEIDINEIWFENEKVNQQLEDRNK